MKDSGLAIAFWGGIVLIAAGIGAWSVPGAFIFAGSISAIFGLVGAIAEAIDSRRKEDRKCESKS